MTINHSSLPRVPGPTLQTKYYTPRAALLLLAGELQVKRRAIVSRSRNVLSLLLFSNSEIINQIPVLRELAAANGFRTWGREGSWEFSPKEGLDRPTGLFVCFYLHSAAAVLLVSTKKNLRIGSFRAFCGLVAISNLAPEAQN